MVLLQPQPPTISADDNFKLTYHGKYGKVVYDKSKGENVLEIIEGPLPKGRFVWDAVDYLGGLESGQSKLVPFDLVRVYFGDPRSKPRIQQKTEDRRGNKGDIAPRENEVRRLRVLYGAYDSEGEWLDKIVPLVTIFTADDIEVITVAQDPEGEYVYGHIENEDETHDVATRLLKLEEQTKMLKAQLRAEEAKGTPNTGDDVTTDEPPSSPTARRK
jgi:hypothetical protein